MGGTKRGATIQTAQKLAGGGIVLISRHRMVVLTVTVLVVAAMISSWAWRRWGDLVTSDPRFALEAAKLRVTPQPDWIRSNVKRDVIRDGSLEQLSLLDTELVSRIAAAFELNPWVREVVEVRKSAGGRIDVRLAYRRPLIMVAANDGFWPVDAEGILLPPMEFTSDSVREYIQVHTAHSRPAGPIGSSYGDPRILDAARIATLIEDEWSRLGIQKIVAGATARRPYELQTAKGSRVIWGSAPGNEAAGEPRAEEKLKKLLDHTRQNGVLDRGDPITIDLTTP